MSKVICDVCGTAYPETASVCPICGCAKNTTAQTAADGAAEAETVSAYNYVKGGRFSKKNVRKRNKKNKDYSSSGDSEDGQEGSNKGLVIVIVVLLLAIIAVLIYIGVRFILPDGSSTVKQTNPPITTTRPIETTTLPPAQIPCTGLKLSSTTIELTEAGTVWLLSAEAEPTDTTDTITFTSSNEKVVTVSENGNITAVGGGEAVITVTCGDITAECKVICSFEAITDPTEDTTVPPAVDVPDGFVLKLNRSDFTLSREGETWTLYKETNGVKASDITWTSADPEIATVENGVVTGVDYGDTTITATIGDQTVTCTVRVRFHGTGTGTGGEEGGETTSGVKISHNDVTIEVGETFMLTLTTSEGAKIQVEWTASEEGFVTIDGSRITGLAAGENGAVKRITVSTTYEGETYSCTVRVKPKAET